LLDIGTKFPMISQSTDKYVHCIYYFSYENWIK